MPPLPLVSKPYIGKSIIASAQRCINLYPERNTGDDQAPSPVTHYLTPGSLLYKDSYLNRPVRCSYRTTIGTSYVVIGTVVYYLDYLANLTPIGFVADKPTQIYAADNGLVTIIVDGEFGYVIDMATNRFAQITDASFYGASFVVFLDTFFVFNRPNTNQFFLSASMANWGMFTNTAIGFGEITSPGSGYVGAIYYNVPLTGGSGSGAVADITVTPNYINSISITTGGSSYTNGTYSEVPLTGGTGSGATANIIISGNIITSLDIVNKGYDYTNGDVLSANVFNIGGTGSGFTATISSVISGVTLVSLNIPGENYAVSDVLSASAADLGGSGSGFQWTVTELTTAFDPLDIAAKAGNADPIVGIMAIHRELWLVGELTTEVWIGTGAADFYFQQVQGAFIDHGCAAPYSCSNQDILGFWLMRDKQGKCIVVQGSNYQVREISTHAIVNEFQTYSVVSDAIGFCFQISDHAFYVLTFPTANKTWMYDLTTDTWCEWNWTDNNGMFNRARANCCMFVYDKNIIGDWQNGKLYELRSDVYTDDGQPIVRLRTFPHLLDNLDRTEYLYFKADIEVGTQDPTNPVAPEVSLKWSDNRGKTFGNAVTQSLGLGGDYLALPIWSRLGMARDRVFELSWSCNLSTSLNGAFINTKKATS